MTIPDQAILETIIDFPSGNPGIVIYDVSNILAIEAKKLTKIAIKNGKRRKKPFGTRDPKNIQFCIIHKSGSNGPSGFQGCRSTTNFVVYHRGWEGAAYTFWVSRKPDMKDNRIVVYRMQPDNVRSWHTGGKMNELGIGIGVQGNYDSQWDLLSNGLPKIEKNPTTEQMVALNLLMKYVEKRYGIKINDCDNKGKYYLTGHYEHGKRVCPGDALRSWLEWKRRPGTFSKKSDSKVVYQASLSINIDPYNFTPEQYQQALYKLGFYFGSIDGIIGDEIKLALEEFQISCGLIPDGWYGPKTAKMMKSVLESRDLLKLQNFNS